jgi:hypothetical protein
MIETLNLDLSNNITCRLHLPLAWSSVAGYIMESSTMLAQKLCK